MTDCPNAEMRDRLPDLLHERLEQSVRVAVMAHIDECDDCRAEMVLLREARIVLSPEVRAVDIVAISRVIVERMATPVSARSRRSPWMNWRIAASVVVLLLGAGSVGLFVRARERVSSVAMVADTAPVVPNDAAPTTPSETAPAATTATAELSAAASVSDLSESELRALLSELDQIDAVPSAEPERVNVRVSLPGDGSSE